MQHHGGIAKTMRMQSDIIAKSLRYGAIKKKKNVCLLKRGVTGVSWWRHQMETFSALLTIYAGNSPVPVTRSFDVFFDLRLNKRLCKQSRRWWFETPSSLLWRHCNDNSPRVGSLQLRSVISQLREIQMLQKHLFIIFNHIHIWQVSPLLCCGNSRQIWKWHCIGKQCFDDYENCYITEWIEIG